uniref:NADH-ubiquinone oxidoreductase chain 6 n=1 Tax=Pantaleon erectonodatus TaxID=3065215 RepID=A0AA95SSN1_9HEMI|nr:NADH dehydrogenase subunit 6 [Pantaleon erectonodatus]WKZ08107.1 NADH dehydrogenase subunit 6 [Pantaleon erectonodatus]
MKIMLLKMMTSISIMSMMMSNPMSMGLTLLMQTTLTILIMNMVNLSSWIPMITFLTMIGGLLIIFMYMSSITSNEMFKLNLNTMLPLILMMLIMEEMTLNDSNQEFQMIQSSMNNMMSMNKLYSKSMSMTMMMVLYLLLTMISVNKIIKLFEGPLRSG